MSQAVFTKRLMVALAALVVAVGFAGTATASAQTQEDTDFSSGTPDANTEVVPPGDLALKPTFDIVEDFDGAALPAGWESVLWPPGDGAATVAGGVLTVDGARANTTGLYGPGRSLDFEATFSGQAFQHVGLSDNLGGAPWAMFSTGGGALPVGFYARTLGASGQDTPLTVDPTLPHTYGIEWTPSAVRYFVDGAPVAMHAIEMNQQMRPIASDAGTGGGGVEVAFLDLYSHPASGTFTSRVFDAGDGRATWRTLAGTLDTPPGTGVSFEVRTGSTPTPDGSWTGYQPVGSGGQISSPVGRRYLQYRATLTTTDASITPFLEGVTLTYDVDSTAPGTTIGDVTVNGTTARITFSSEAGAAFECSLDNGPFQACTSPKEYTGLTAGSHTVRVRAIDQVGNVGPAAERSFSIASVTPPQPPDKTAPKVRPSSSSVKVSRTGRFKVRLRCPSKETSCRIVLLVRYRGKTVASKRVTVAGGDTETVTLRLNRRARTVLQTSRRIRVAAVTTARDAAGNSATTRMRLSLRASGSG